MIHSEPERNVLAGLESIQGFLPGHPESLVHVLGNQPVPLPMVHELLAVLHQLPNPGRIKSVEGDKRPNVNVMPVSCLLCKFSGRLLWQKPHANRFRHHLVESHVHMF